MLNYQIRLVEMIADQHVMMSIEDWNDCAGTAYLIDFANDPKRNLQGTY
jgi:hypothetical protein